MAQKKLSTPVKKTSRPPKEPSASLVVYSSLFGRVYAVLAVIVLLATTCFWGLLGARIQQSNADQLVDPYLFQNLSTFHGAYIPGQHSYLLKWPLFLLIKLFGYSNNAYIAATLAVVLITVVGLVIFLYWIERRPLIFGTLCLLLASVLLLVPAQPYPGALLPVNMAMITTRNIEYILYMVSLLLIIRAVRVKNWRFWLAVLLLTLLITSDSFF